MIIREQQQLPSALVDANTPLSPTVVTPTTREAPVATDSPPIMSLTRESLWKHTKLQEQLYIATASPDRNILFVNETRDMEYSSTKRQRHSLKRSHSPDMSSTDRCKTGRHSIESPPVPAAQSIMNPVFPLMTYENVIASSVGQCKSSPNGRMMVPMQMYPIVSIQSDEQVANSQIQSSSSMPGGAMPCSYDHITGNYFKVL